jgi:hypothetical protein
MNVWHTLLTGHFRVGQHRGELQGFSRGPASAPQTGLSGWGSGVSGLEK